MRVLTILFSAAETAKIQPGQCKLIYALSTGPSAVVTADPALVYADLSSPSTQTLRSDVLALVYGGVGGPIPAVPLTEQPYFVTAGNAGTVLLVFEP